MTALTVDVLRVFFAFTVVVAIVTIAGVVITNTADVDSMADPAPRPGEDEEESEQPSRVILGWCIAAQHTDCPGETDSRTHPGVRLRCTCDCGHQRGWPRVPDEQMRIIDAALPKAQAWGRWVQYREAEKQ